MPTSPSSSLFAVALGADHAGFHLKDALKDRLQRRGHPVRDVGTHGPESVDYPDYAAEVARLLTSGDCSLGLLVCGTGVGMSIAANRFPEVRAVVCSEPYSARMARAHNDANVLCLGARVVGEGLADEILDAFLEASFEGGRHARRVAKLTHPSPPPERA